MKKGTWCCVWLTASRWRVWDAGEYGILGTEMYVVWVTIEITFIPKNTIFIKWSILDFKSVPVRWNLVIGQCLNLQRSR